MSKPQILLTGATGMVGFRVLVLALEAGYRVRVVVRNQEGFERIKLLAPVAPYVDWFESFLVPDMTLPGAYDDAVSGVEYIIHVASPLALPHLTDFENDLIKPAMLGTIGMLESAYKTSGIKKIVITSSSAAIKPPSDLIRGTGPTEPFNEKSRAPHPEGPYSNVLEAYMASKALSLEATETFIKERKPSFDVINIGPGYIVGRDDTVTQADGICKGTNGFAMGQLLGKPIPYPVASLMSHLDDVARVHVESLSPSIKGNHFFLISAESPDGVTWDRALEIAREHYAKEVEDGLFKVDAGTGTVRLRADSSYAEKMLGFKLKTYEQAVKDVVDHYLELVGRTSPK
ncbi:uncharacterized protein N7518_010452 [Penicillium psychrosexuale]|uniref:uncharacterized protein n=1 Tax=Penicillium psychrosexuale TaxID=1002107 RepID=UPI0025458F23|nr:uncharacterized protein N7518_010452 [Penicillium psychrosexuale]KAJ5781969.1 hypothetical protein N7518_010452 [Penicillium psychrosexuale]